MCILFIFAENSVEGSDYKFILASNRDEYYDRPAAEASIWPDDPNVFGGRDMEKGREGGTWLALSPLRRRLGVLLNLSGRPKQDPKARGHIVANFVKSTITFKDYTETLQPFAEEFNDFNIVTAEIGENVLVQCYSNVTNQLESFENGYFAFGNSLSNAPFKKVKAGKNKFEDICKTWNKVKDKDHLVRDLIDLLKWDERHLPDDELKRRCPLAYEKLSSIYVNMPEGRYGTRTHTIVLVTKTGKSDFIEVTMKPPINPQQPEWQQTRYQFDIETNNCL